MDMLPGASTISIDTLSSNITQQGFTVQVSTTQDTSISEVAGQWMAVPSQPPSWTTDYQTGHFGILSARERADTGYTNTAGDVVFARRYATAPRVVVWITAFDFGVGATWRLNAFPTNIRGRGFTVNVNTWSNTVLYSANVSWVAWPAEDKSVIGNYWHPQVARLNGTGDDVEMAGFGNTSFVSFDKGVSRRMFPELLMGFSQFDVWRGPVGMKLRIENGVRREGTDCTVRSFGNVTLNNNVNLAWLAAT
ncbi:hypothetical protein B0T25DRAFT_536663 [Lasiosphaeria hispida]|uniref:H-type lectin domain-containing protein n=1 Tax=Lasiosphaeria hispida TaxID=260671 RepID=A0AAJ0HKE3_9PEZI|nr:hypothetical protein B0T25DRAFT_536663 [Lasiosphaeria hispida]